MIKNPIKYSIYEEWPDYNQEHKGDFNLFALEDFWNLRTLEVKYLPISVRNLSGELVAFWCFAQLENDWTSPYKAPYFEPFIKEGNDLSDILPQVISYLKAKADHKIIITLPPLFLLKEKSLVSSFTKERAEIVNIEISSYLFVSRENSFVDNIRRKRKRRQLKKLLHASISIEEAKSDEWATNYQLLLGWRQQKGHKNLIDAQFMSRAKAILPTRFRGLLLRNDSAPLAIAVFLKVRKDCYYVYALITNPAFHKENFSLLLWNKLYELAQKENVQYIDMGTSMEQPNLINKGLLRNKISIGAILSRKYSIKC